MDLDYSFGDNQRRQGPAIGVGKRNVNESRKRTGKKKRNHMTQV